MATKKEVSAETVDAPVASTPATPPKKSNKTLWIILAVILVLFVLIPAILLLVGGIFLKNQLSSDKTGERLAETLIEKASGNNVDVDTKDGNFNVTSDDGNTSLGFGSDQKLPDDFPKSDIPYIDEEAVTFVVTSENEGKQNWSVTTTVSRSYEEAVKFFEDRIKEPDYADASSYGFGSESKSFYGTKAPYSVSVTVSKQDGKTSVSYIITQQ